MVCVGLVACIGAFGSHYGQHGFEPTIPLLYLSQSNSAMKSTPTCSPQPLRRETWKLPGLIQEKLYYETILIKMQSLEPA